jgi:hypothetical protein
MTLFLMPVLYYIFNRIREKRDAKKAEKRKRLQLAYEQLTGGNA